MRNRRASALVALALAGCSQPTGPENVISGEQLYSQYCARCHGVDGVPTAAAPTSSNFSDPRVIELVTDDTIKGVIQSGRGQMPGFGDQFTEVTLQVLAQYVRSLSASETAPPAAP